jgi:predicted choloylglycine hydrolase
MSRWWKKLPFRELGIPLKMLKGRLRNRGKHLTPFRELTLPNGSLQVIDGVPLVRVRGTPREMGRALGTLVGVQAAETFHSYMQCFAPDFEGDLKLAREMEPQLPEWFTEEMRGFSETSELTYAQMLVGQCFLDIHKVAACSTIAVHDSATETGEMLMGRNLDFPSLDIAHEANIVVVYEGEVRDSSFEAREKQFEPRTSNIESRQVHHPTPNTQHPTPAYATVTWPGFLGALTGLNEAGLALSMMLVYGHVKHEHLRGQPFPLVFRRLLRECATVRQADDVLRGKPYCTATNLILADAQRTAARFQLHPTDPVVEYTSAESPATACTNHYHERRIRKFAFTWFSSVLRYRRLIQRIGQGDKWTVQRIKDALQATGIPMINLQRAIMEPEQRTLHVAFENLARGPGRWVEFTRDQLFGQPEALAISDRETVEAAR